MSFSQTTKLILIITSSVILVGSAIAIPTSIVVVRNNNTINFNLLYNAGVMIESKGVRIYIDPIDLPDNYSDLPADAILITHEHGDHYQSSMLTMLEKEDTLFVFPEILDSYIALYDGLGVVPGDTFQVGHILVTCFYMYTLPPPGYPASHPQESNYTSYLININGFTFFHAGDSSNIPEYSELNGLVDVALLPLGPGCQTMADNDVVLAIDTIDPTYFIPIHFAAGADVIFCTVYDTAIENTGCILKHMSYFSATTFTA